MFDLIIDWLLNWSFEPSHWHTFFALIIGGAGGFVLAGIMYAGAYADQINEDALRELERRHDVEQMARESQR